MSRIERRWFVSGTDQQGNPTLRDYEVDIERSTLPKPTTPEVWMNAGEGVEVPEMDLYTLSGLAGFTVLSLSPDELKEFRAAAEKTTKLMLRLYEKGSRVSEEWHWGGVRYEWIVAQKKQDAPVDVRCTFTYSRMKYTDYSRKDYGIVRMLPKPKLATRNPQPTDNRWNGIIGLATLGSAAAALWWMLG
jgi:hypothetical protein